MKINKEQLQVYAVTDRKSVNNKRYATLIDAVEAAIKGGATIVQLREKELSEDAFLAEAKEIKKLTQRYGVPLIINDNVALLGTPDDRAAILAVSETSVRVSQSVSPLLFSIISMKWLWDGAYASGFAVGILILLVAFFVFEPRTAPSQK